MDLNFVPVASSPAGVLPNLTGSAPSRRKIIIGVCSTFIILTTVFVVLRIYVAFKITKLRTIENYLCVLATVFSFGYMLILIHLSYASRHMWDVPLAWMVTDENYWKLRLSQNLLNPLAFFFSRVPVFMLYSRIFQSLRRFRLACITGIAAAFLIYVHTVPVVAVLCTPRRGEKWTDQSTFARCSRGKPDSVAQGIGNIVLDLYGLVLPLPVVWGLHLPQKKKIGVMVVFLTGSFALIASCISLYYRIRLTYGNDTNWDEGAYDASSAIEINVAIICSCMPSLSSLLKAKSTDRGLWVSLRSIFRSQRSATETTILDNETVVRGFMDNTEFRDRTHLTDNERVDSWMRLQPGSGENVTESVKRAP